MDFFPFLITPLLQISNDVTLVKGQITSSSKVWDSKVPPIPQKRKREQFDSTPGFKKEKETEVKDAYAWLSGNTATCSLPFCFTSHFLFSLERKGNAEQRV